MYSSTDSSKLQADRPTDMSLLVKPYAACSSHQGNLPMTAAATGAAGYIAAAAGVLEGAKPSTADANPFHDLV